MADHVFTYGSLMFAPVWQRVVRGEYDAISASLIGFARYRVRGERYPGATAHPKAQIVGKLYLAVAPSDLQALDEFEERKYAREQVLVTTESGATLPAWIYVYLRTERLTQSPWSPEKFEQTEMQAFLAEYKPSRDLLTR